jgi:hypothetical protein
MAEDEIPKLADWLAEYRSRPEPREVIVASYDLTQPIPDDSAHGMSEGQTGIEIVTYDLTDWPGPADNSHYVMGVDGDGQHLWDDWYESEDAAREAIESGQYGDLVKRERDTS